MALENEADQVMGRFPGGASIGAGSYINFRTFAVFQSSSDTTLPLLDYWHMLPATAGNASLATCAANLNTALGSGYAYTGGNLHTYTSADLPQSKGQGASDG